MKKQKFKKGIYKLINGLFICLLNYGLFLILDNVDNKLFLDSTICWLVCTLVFFMLNYDYSKKRIRIFIEKFFTFIDKTFLVLILQIIIIYVGIYLFKLSAYLTIIISSLISYIIIYPLIQYEKINKHKEVNNIKEDGKIKWVSIFKGIMIILMVIGHSPTIYGTIIYSFHMAAFFMLSGYLFKITDESFVEFAKRRFKSLIIPFVQIVLVTTVIAVIASTTTDIFYAEKIDFSLLYYFLRYLVAPDLAGATWFLPTLFFTSLIFKFVTDCFNKKEFNDKKKCIYALIVCIILGLWGYTYYNNHEGLSYNFDLAFLSTYMFALGFSIKIFLSNINIITKDILLIISIIFFIYYNYSLVSGLDWPSRVFPNMFLLTAISLSGFYIMYNLCIKISNLPISNKLLCYIGNNSIDVLGYHFLGFRVLFFILYTLNIVGIEQTRSLLALYNGTKYGVATALFAVAFSLIFGRVVKIIFNIIYSLLSHIAKKIKIFTNYIYTKIFQYIKRLSKKEKTILGISIVISVVQVILTFFFDKLIFIEQGNVDNIVIQPWMYFCKVLYFIILVLCWNKILQKKVKNYKFIIAYLLIMIMIFILVYPGIWRWDDIINLGSITDGHLYYWQHWLSGAYFYLCMCFIPTASGIVFVQILIMSIIVGHIIGNEYNKIGKKALFLYIPFLLPSVIDSNFYPIRASICAYIELYLFYELLNFNSNGNKNIKIVYLMIITSLLSVWRPENIVYIFIIPILFIFIYKISIKKVAVMLIIGLSIMVTLMGIQTRGLQDNAWISTTGNIMSEKELYTLSGLISPLENLVKLAIERNEFQEELKQIDEVVSIEKLSKEGTLSAFWGGGLKSITPKQLDMMKKITIKMAIAYMPEFLSERYYLFLSSNGYIENAQLFLHGSAHIYNHDNIVEVPEDIKREYNEFETRYIANKPFNVDIRRKIISLLEMKKETSFNTGNRIMSMVFYNCTIPVIITCIVWGIVLFKKKWCLALMITALAAKFSIIVATAPMSAYMYYFSTYLICCFISAYGLINLVSKIKFKKIVYKNIRR